MSSLYPTKVKFVLLIVHAKWWRREPVSGTSKGHRRVGDRLPKIIVNFLIGALIRDDKKETKLGPQKDIAGETFLRPERLFHKEDYPMQVILMRE